MAIALLAAPFAPPVRSARITASWGCPAPGGALQAPPVPKAAPSLEQVPAAVRRALELALDRKALGPVLLEVRTIAGYTDWVLLLSGRSDRHVEGITQAIVTGLKEIGIRNRGADGLSDHLWDLLDYDDFIVHVFYHPVRVHYDLESMWSDAPRVELGLPDEVMDTSQLAHLAAPDPMPGYRGDTFGALPGELDDDDDDDDLPYYGDDGEGDLAEGESR